MERYRAYGQEDDQPLSVGDENFLGVDEYNDPENVRPGYVQNAVNTDFTTGNAKTRGGFVCLPELGTAPFGQKWTYSAIDGSTANFNGVAYGNGYFVAIGGSGVVFRSTNAATWASGGSTNLFSGSAIAFDNGIFIAGSSFLAGGYSCLARSADGQTWTNPTIGTQVAVNSIAYGNGVWVAAGSDGSFVSPQYASAVSSDNGLTWTATIHSSFGPGQFRNVFFANGSFLAADLTHVWKSIDGVTWVQQSSISDQIVGFAFGNQTFVALGYQGSVYTSKDAITWTQRRASDGDTWTSVIYGNGTFVAFASNSGGDNVMFSIDATSWIRISGVPNYSWVAATYANGLFVSVGASGASMSSKYVGVSVFASAIYSDPSEIGVSWVMLLGGNSVGFYAFGHTSRTVSLGSYTVNAQSTIVQANNQVFIFRGDSVKPLYWSGDWNASFVEVPDTTLPATYNSIVNSNQATYYQNRLWIRDGKDSVAASDVLAFTDYDPLANEFNLNTGNSDYVVATFPFGQTSLVCFKNKSIQLMQQVDGALTDVIVTEITRQVGLVGINAVTSVGPDLAYVSYGNINLLTLTSTNNALQHKTLPLSAAIRKIMDRVNWNYGYKISLGYWNNRLYVALPLDNSQFCNAVVVYNFITESWFGEWSFDSTMNMCAQGWQVVDYLGLQRLHCITEDGRIFVTDEGQNDISGATVAEISTSLTTRAYNTASVDNEKRGLSNNHFQRRLYIDIATLRPNFSVSSYTEGVSEESTLLTNQTYTRSQSWRFSDSAYDLTNANNDYNRAYRRDYSTGPASVQCGTGFLPEAVQHARLPMITQRQGRLSWMKVTNTQGVLHIYGLGFEARAGQRSNTVQV